MSIDIYPCVFPYQAVGGNYDWIACKTLVKTDKMASAGSLSTTCTFHCTMTVLNLWLGVLAPWFFLVLCPVLYNRLPSWIFWWLTSIVNLTQSRKIWEESFNEWIVLQACLWDIMVINLYEKYQTIMSGTIPWDGDAGLFKSKGIKMITVGKWECMHLFLSADAMLLIVWHCLVLHSDWLYPGLTLLHLVTFYLTI